MATVVNSLPASTSLRNEFKALAPDKETEQNGTIGDVAHQKEGKSDHLPDETTPALKGKDSDNKDEVHARDEDSRGPWPAGWSMMRVVLIIVARCRAGVEKRLRYIIFDGWIWEASNGWRKRKFTGADQHTTHAHFSFVYGSGSGPTNPENITTPWGFLAAYEAEQDMPDLNEIFNTDIVPTASNASDAKTNPKRTLAQALSNIEYHTRAAEESAGRIAALETTVKAYLVADAKDAATKDAALKALQASMTTLTPALSSAVAAELAKLDTDVEVPQAQLNEAVLAGLRTLFSQ